MSILTSWLDRIVAGWLLIPIGTVVSLAAIGSGIGGLWTIGAAVAAGGCLCFMWQSEVPKQEAEPYTTWTGEATGSFGQTTDTSHTEEGMKGEN